MTIQLHKAGKRYNRDWIFRNLSYTFGLGNHYAITGPNGSGKSTLLQILSGSLTTNEGSFDLLFQNKKIAPEKVFKHISFCAPYLELVEELTFSEFLSFHHSFKPFLNGLTIDFIANEVQLYNARHKKISEYSSGMKQRAKLAQCFFSDTPVVLLDEPCTNLDTSGIALYHHLIEKYGSNRLVIVSSNDEVEYSFCKEVVDMMGY